MTQKKSKAKFPKVVAIHLDKDGQIKVDTGDTSVIEFLGMLESAKVLVSHTKGEE